MLNFSKQETCPNKNCLKGTHENSLILFAKYGRKTTFLWQNLLHLATNK